MIDPPRIKVIKISSSEKACPPEKTKIVNCYLCNKKFDMEKEEGSRFRYGKYPLCAYCAEFYGFYFDDPKQKRKEKI